MPLETEIPVQEAFFCLLFSSKRHAARKHPFALAARPYPNIFPATEEEIVHKFLFFKEMLEKMGVPIIDDELVELVKVRLNQISNL